MDKISPWEGWNNVLVKRFSHIYHEIYSLSRQLKALCNYFEFVQHTPHFCKWTSVSYLVLLCSNHISIWFSFPVSLKTIQCFRQPWRQFGSKMPQSLIPKNEVSRLSIHTNFLTQAQTFLFLCILFFYWNKDFDEQPEFGGQILSWTNL